MTPSLETLRSDVVIIGAGPGLLLSHLLAADGVESIVVESRSAACVAARIRAGILEHSTVDLLRQHGLAERLEREGDEHRGIYLTLPEEKHLLDFVDLTGRSVWVYGQTDVQKDLVAAREADGQQVLYECGEVTLHELETERPAVELVHDDRRLRIEGRVVAGCDGSFGPSRASVPSVALLAPALVDLVRKGDVGRADAYSDDALRRVWRCTHFSWWMTSMLHTSDNSFGAQLQLSQLRWVTSSEAGRTGLAENYAGRPIGR